jgi:hypothetical protein
METNETNFIPITQGLEKYQDKTLPGMREESNKRFDRPWKLNPSDIANFYLLDGFIEKNKGWQEDPVHIDVLKAKVKVGEIKKKVTSAFMAEILEEFEAYGEYNKKKELTGDNVDLLAIRRHFGQPEIGEYSERDFAYISDYAAECKKKLLNPQNDAPDTDIYSPLCGVLNKIMVYDNWKDICGMTQALVDPKISHADALKTFGVHNPDQDALDRMAEGRDRILIERLLNTAHFGGLMLARVTNDYPVAQVVFDSHGLPEGKGVISHYSTLRHEQGPLGSYVRDQEADETFEETVVNQAKRKYKIDGDFYGSLNPPENKDAAHALVVGLQEYPKAQRALIDMLHVSSLGFSKKNNPDLFMKKGIYTTLSEARKNDGSPAR